MMLLALRKKLTAIMTFLDIYSGMVPLVVYSSSIINIIYLFFYWINGNSAAQVSVLSFIPMFYIQIFYYLGMIRLNMSMVGSVK